MENYDVILYPTAKQDLLDIIDYLNTLSPDAALRYYDLLTEEIASLSKMPKRCPRPKDLALAAKGYRYLIVKDYLVDKQLERCGLGRENLSFTDGASPCAEEYSST